MAASPLCENVTPLENLESAEDGFIPNPGIDTLLYTDFFSPDLWLPYGNQVGNDIFRTQSPESTLQDGHRLPEWLPFEFNSMSNSQGHWDECSPSEWSIDTFASTPSSYTWASSPPEEVEPASESRLRCCKCSKKFENAYSLEQHAKMTGHRIFVCPEPGCNMSYPRRDSLTRHKRTHNNLELRCELCPVGVQRKTFKRKDHLLAHMRNCHPYSRDSAGSFSLAKAPQSFGTSSGGSSCSCSRSKDNASFVQEAEFESRAVQDIVSEIKRIHGDDSQVLRALDERLDLNSGSSTEQVARILADFALFTPSGPTTKSEPSR